MCFNSPDGWQGEHRCLAKAYADGLIEKREQIRKGTYRGGIV